MSLPTSWGNQYLSRKTSKYRGEDVRHPFDESNKAAFIDSLFAIDPFSLNPPPSLSHIHLRDFLRDAVINIPPRSIRSPVKSHDTIFIDDRRSHLDEAIAGDLEAKSNWAGHLGKHEILEVPHFYKYVCETERHKSCSNAERRMIYTASPSGDALLAMIATVSMRTRPIILHFLQQHLVSQAPAEIFLSCSRVQFSMGFHFPFLALREGPRKKDERVLFGSDLRQSKPLPLTLPNGIEIFHYYEAKVSYMVTGIDDFFFTTYLLADTYQGGSEVQRNNYAKAYKGLGIDPASMRTFEFPYWNPREHMFASLAVRLAQATEEVTQMMDTFDRNMRRYEEQNTACFDNLDQSQTQDLSLTVDTLHHLKTVVQNMVMAWSKFLDSHLDWLVTTENKSLSKSLRSYQTIIEHHVTELEALTHRLEDRCIRFNGRLERITSASSLRHNASVATMQEDITKLSRTAYLFTSIAFFFLGLNLVVAIFGMNMIPEDTHPAWPAVSLVLVALIFFSLTIDPRPLNLMLPP